MTNNNTAKGDTMKTTPEPTIVYGEEKCGRRVARLSNGGMCIVERTYKPEKKSWKWEAVQCKPNVCEIENCNTGETERYVLGYEQLKGWKGDSQYGSTRKEAVLSCLIDFWM